jgi:hypothetical protein
MASCSLVELVREFTMLLSAPLVVEFVPSLSFLDRPTFASIASWRAKFESFMDRIIDEREKEHVRAADASLAAEPHNMLDALMHPHRKLSKPFIRAMLMVIEIDRLYYRLRKSNMTYETKNITFHVIRVEVSSDSRCSTTLLMNVAIERTAHCGCEINSCKDWTQSKRCGKRVR